MSIHDSPSAFAFIFCSCSWRALCIISAAVDGIRLKSRNSGVTPPQEDGVVKLLGGSCMDSSFAQKATDFSCARTEMAFRRRTTAACRATCQNNRRPNPQRW
eukprot:6376762-Prymnesium_polylepis.1